MLGQEYSRLIIIEVSRVVVLTVLIAVIFLVGIKAEAVGSAAKWVFGRVVMGEVQVEWNPTPTTDPWMLTDGDLDYQRVVMNLTSKPGFMWLSIYAISAMVGVGVVLATTQMVMEQLVVWVRRFAYLLRHVNSLGFRMSGTVRISARSGTIYFSGLSRALMGAMDEYAQIFRMPEVTVVPA